MVLIFVASCGIMLSVPTPAARRSTITLSDSQDTPDETASERLKALLYGEHGERPALFKQPADLARTISSLAQNPMPVSSAATALSHAVSGRKPVGPSALAAIFEAIHEKDSQFGRDYLDEVVREVASLINHIQIDRFIADNDAVGRHTLPEGKRWIIFPTYLKLEIPEVSRLLSHIPLNLFTKPNTTYLVSFANPNTAKLFFSKILESMVDDYEKYLPDLNPNIPLVERVTRCANQLKAWDEESRLAFYVVPKFFALCPTMILNPENPETIDGEHVFYTPNKTKADRLAIPKPYLLDWHWAYTKLLAAPEIEFHDWQTSDRESLNYLQMRVRFWTHLDGIVEALLIRDAEEEIDNAWQ